MHLALPQGFYLDSIQEGDQAAYMEHFSDRALTDALVAVPYPYTHVDADQWVRMRIAAALEQPLESQFALRRPDGFLVGGCGLVLQKGAESHRAELGYWVASDYRRRGLIRAAAGAVVAHGFSALGLKRIQAWAKVSNTVSQHILETTGFVREGLVRGYHQKDGVLFDSYLYGQLRDDGMGE